VAFLFALRQTALIPMEPRLYWAEQLADELVRFSEALRS
jgi:hypothetical protein